ncbi:MAG: hypothetical protein ACRDHZ_19115 [Ktedonobacteraceae bacterium]
MIEAIVIGILVIIALIFWKRSKVFNARAALTRDARSKKYNDDYEIWLDIFKKEKSNIREFDLFGTKAAIAWNEGDSEVVVICATEFRSQEPITKKWDNYEFNIEEKYWSRIAPKGSAERIREEIKVLNLI